MTPEFTAALTDLYAQHKILQKGYVSFTELSTQQDVLVERLQALFDNYKLPKDDEEPEEIVSYLFKFINVRSGANLAIAELPHDREEMMALLKDVTTEELHLNVPYGNDYTLFPIIDPAQEVLISLYQAWRVMMKGCFTLNDLMSCRDRVVMYVNKLFGTHKCIQMMDKDAIAKYVLWKRGKAENYQPVEMDRTLLVDFKPLDDDRAAAAAKQAEEEEELERLEVCV